MVFLLLLDIQFHLTCEDEWLQPMPSVSYMVGMLVGSLVLGVVADA